MWQQWTNVILGVALIATPFLGLTMATMTWVLVAAGLIIAVMGIWGAQETTTEREQGKMVQRMQY